MTKIMLLSSILDVYHINLTPPIVYFGVRQASTINTLDGEAIRLQGTDIAELWDNPVYTSFLVKIGTLKFDPALLNLNAHIKTVEVYEYEAIPCVIGYLIPKDIAQFDADTDLPLRDRVELCVDTLAIKYKSLRNIGVSSTMHDSLKTKYGSKKRPYEIVVYPLRHLNLTS